MKTITSILLLTLVIMAGVGWIKCVVKLVKSDFKAPYKSEVIYGVGTFTGAGSIIGWIDIE